MILSAEYGTLIEALESAPPDRLFLLEWHDEQEQRQVTFDEFRGYARKYAAFMQHHGLRCADRVVFILPQGIALMAAFVGSMMMGALPAILAYPNERVDPAKYGFGLRGVTKNLDAPFIIVDEGFPEKLTSDLSVTDSTRIVRLPALLDGLSELSQTSVHPQGLAFIQHSAGTTGLQKGVALSHLAILTQLGHLAKALNIDENDRVYSWLPLYHDMGLIACFMLPMACHLPVILQSPTEWVRRPETMLQLIHEHRCTLAWLPNFAFQFVPRRTSQDAQSRINLSSVRALINCSEPVKTESMAEFYAAFSSRGLQRSALQSSYAMAENVFAVTQSRPGGSLTIQADGGRFRSEHLIEKVPPGTPEAVSFTSSGQLLPHNQARIVSESGEVLSPGRVGEILIKSDSLFDGYYNRPDLTAPVLTKGWFHTGDLGFFCEDELFVVGRKKDLLIVGGENIYPQDVEEIVAEHGAIHDGRVVAFGLFNFELGTEDLVVVAEVERQDLLEAKAQVEREIRSAVSAQLGVAIRFLVLKPTKWIVKSTAGKPARSATREKLLKEHPELQRN